MMHCDKRFLTAGKISNLYFAADYCKTKGTKEHGGLNRSGDVEGFGGDGGNRRGIELA